MLNPLSDQDLSERDERHLVAQAVDGDRSALERIVHLHQPWIYNIALRMVWYPPDAEDVTQEVLVKMITNLATFRGESRFRTWLYRILSNYVMKMQKRAAERNWFVQTFEDYGRCLDDIPDRDLPDTSALPVDADLLVQETRIACKMGMLLCLNRDLRLAFILGAVFGISEQLGSEVMGIEKANFRQRVSRARRRLLNFMGERCELMHEGNPCHCRRKTKALIELGNINPRKLNFSKPDLMTVKDIVRVKSFEFGIFGDERCEDLFRQDPFHDSPDFVSTLRSIVEDSFYARFH